MRGRNLLFLYFTSVSHQTMKSILNVKKRSDLIQGICRHKICSGIKSQQVKKLFVVQYQKLLIFLRIIYYVPFHRVTFDHSISGVLLIDKPNESCQNSKKIKRNAISTTKKNLKRKGNSITPAKTNAPISQTSSEGLKLIIQTYQMRNKELKMKLGQLQEEISKASLPVSSEKCFICFISDCPHYI